MASKSGKFVNASRTYSVAGLLLSAAASLGFSTAPVAAQNYAPPPGAVFDLDGQSLPETGIPAPYSTEAEGGFQIDPADISNGEATLTFLFRDDFSYIYFSDVELYNVSDPGQSLLANGDFSDVNTSSGLPKDWTYTNPNASDSGVFPGASLDKNCSVYFGAGSKCWRDGTSGGYDELSQTVKVTAGDTYEISFKATVDGTPLSSVSNATWSKINTSGTSLFGGNAVDVLAYFGTVGQFVDAPPPPPPPPPMMEDVPEPSTWVMMLLGFAGLGFAGYRRARAQAA